MEPAFGKDGLMPCVTQDALTGDVLTLAYVNEEALAATKATGFMHYWSRSRNKLWKKGDESGNYQEVVALDLDCDGDAILAKVKPLGPACHTGETTCFHHRHHGRGDVTIAGLLATIEERRGASASGSYTAKLLGDENLRLKKLPEEAGEVLMAAKDHDKARIAEEAADVIYHLLVVLRAEDVAWRDVMKVLADRRK